MYTYIHTQYTYTYIPINIYIHIQRPSYPYLLSVLKQIMETEKLIFAFYQQYLNFFLKSYNRIYVFDVFIDIIP